jgi:hypothetical protein
VPATGATRANNHEILGDTTRKMERKIQAIHQLCQTPRILTKGALRRQEEEMKIIEIITEKCWDGYRQQGMKKKGDRMVPNCVKKEDIDICVNCGDLVFNESLDEDLRKWFKQKWVRFGPDGKIRGDCARGSSKEGKPKCLPRSKAYALGKKGRATAAGRKRRQDPNANRKGSAKNVKTK